MENNKKKRVSLRPVGIRVRDAEERNNRKAAEKVPKRIKDFFINEIVPSKESIGNLTKSTSSFQKEEVEFNFIEDPRQSSFSYRKFILIEKSLFIIALFDICLSIIKTEVHMVVSSESQVFSTELENVLSLSTIGIGVLLLLRYVCLNELQIDQKKFYYLRKGYNIFYDLLRFFDHPSSVKLFLLELLLLLPHPLSFLRNKTVPIFQASDEIYIDHSINDILGLFSLIRIYIIIRSLVNLTVYAAPRASRLCSHNGVNHNFLYSVKCLLKEEPLRTISSVFLILEISLGYGLKLSEGTLTRTMPNLDNTGFENLINCFWCVFITMTTVGYGDYYPKTLLGRLVIFVTAICGVILSSLLIVSLSAYLTMQPNESKSHITLHRLKHQERLKKEASDALVSTIKLTKFLKSPQNDKGEEMKQAFTQLKQRIDKVKLRNRKIKSLVNSNNIIEEMNRLFELFKDSLQESFKNQIEMKKELSEFDDRSERQRKISSLHLTDKMKIFLEGKK